MTGVHCDELTLRGDCGESTRVRLDKSEEEQEETVQMGWTADLPFCLLPLRQEDTREGDCHSG